MASDKGRKTERIFESEKLEVTELHASVLDGPLAGHEIPCGTRSMRIGSDPDNELVLPDPTVSSHHAVLEHTPSGTLVRDLESTNGSFVDEVRIREAYIRPGSTLRLGRTSLRLVLRTRSEDIPPSASTRFGHLVGRSARMRQLFALLEWVAPTEASVLITGPSGTGKEMVARSLHDASARKDKPFVVLDCGSVDASLMSSEIFGHEAGAFTGAQGRHAGVFEQANHGTVFLDEIGELPLELQPKLLRVLDSREFRRLGGTATIRADVRVLSATNRSLEKMVASGEFREDLYYRLCQLQLTLPRLDERREDIPMLVKAILERSPGERSGSPKTMSAEAMTLLWAGSYPGNVRQLRNIVERASMVSRGTTIEKAHLMLTGNEIAPPAGTSGAVPVPAPIDDRQRILSALAANNNVLIRTAQALGIALNTLKARMKKLSIPMPVRSRDEE